METESGYVEPTSRPALNLIYADPEQERFAPLVPTTPTGPQRIATASNTHRPEQERTDSRLDGAAGSTSPRVGLDPANVDPVESGPPLARALIVEVSAPFQRRSDRERRGSQLTATERGRRHSLHWSA